MATIAAALPNEQDSNERIERELLLQGIRMKYGYDFTHYAESSMRRRIESLLESSRLKSPIEILERVLKQRTYFDQILPRLTITTSEMFRDPQFFKLLREEVFPVLKTFPTLTIWSAGCGAGEEVYSLAIMLEEEGLLDRTTLFATDINPKALRGAREGIFPAEQMTLNTRNYVESGGLKALNHYYSADYGLVKMNKELMRNTVFTEHNLATDHVFTEAHLICCRNVLIYFDRSLQDRALSLFAGSLARRGYLGLGSHENLKHSPFASKFQVCNERWRLFRLRHPESTAGGRGG
jgi:chemotaxis protein methyltransferase CheR